jgi:predicted DsbA family dithiol-disulfide isomerase
MRIDFVSDVACPWCAVGLSSLELALARLPPQVAVSLHFQPFELNPSLAPEGVNAGQYLKAKYGMSDEQLSQARARIHERGAEVGFAFGPREWVWNTFDAHRLLHWASLQDEAGAAPRALHLKRLLLKAYHGQGRNPGAHEVLVDLARQAGLPADEAQAVLQEGRYAAEVRQAEEAWQRAGITGVPAVVVDRRHLISGAQPVAVFERSLRELANQA